MAGCRRSWTTLEYRFTTTADGTDANAKKCWLASPLFLRGAVILFFSRLRAGMSRAVTAQKERRTYKLYHSQFFMAQKSLTWDDVKTFDDLLFPFEVDEIGRIERLSKTSRPYLRRAGEAWYYCGVGVKSAEEKPSPANPAYTKHVQTSDLQLYCMASFERCAFIPRGMQRAFQPP